MKVTAAAQPSIERWEESISILRNVIYDREQQSFGIGYRLGVDGSTADDEHVLVFTATVQCLLQ